MFVNINIWAVLVCAVLSMGLGFVWYGPLFGKKWMEIIKADPNDLEARKQMQKGVMKLYIVQFLLTLFQVFVLAHFVSGFGIGTGIFGSLWLWAGFVVPTIAAASMWNNDSSKVSWARFLIQAGYHMVLFAIFGAVLGFWY